MLLYFIFEKNIHDRYKLELRYFKFYISKFIEKIAF